MACCDGELELRSLTTSETKTSFENWKKHLLQTLSQFADFTEFLADGFSWKKKSKCDVFRGMIDDAERTKQQKVRALELMLGRIACYCPILARGFIINQSTSLEYIWQQIRLHFGFKCSDAQSTVKCIDEQMQAPTESANEIDGCSQNVSEEELILYDGKEFSSDMPLFDPRDNYTESDRDDGPLPCLVINLSYSSQSPDLAQPPRTLLKQRTLQPVGTGSIYPHDDLLEVDEDVGSIPVLTMGYETATGPVGNKKRDFNNTVSAGDEVPVPTMMLQYKEIVNAECMKYNGAANPLQSTAHGSLRQVQLSQTKADTLHNSSKRVVKLTITLKCNSKFGAFLANKHGMSSVSICTVRYHVRGSHLKHAFQDLAGMLLVTDIVKRAWYIECEEVIVNSKPD